MDRPLLRYAPGLLLLLLVGGGIVFAVRDASQFAQVASGLRPGYLLLALASTGGAYLAYTASMRSIADRADAPLPFGPSLVVSFVSQAVNNLFSTGGIGGMALRILGFARCGVRPGITAGFSALTSLAGDVVVAQLALAGVVFLAATARPPMADATLLLAVGLAAEGAAVLALAWIRADARRGPVRAAFARRADALARRVRNVVPSADFEAGAHRFREDLFDVFERFAARPTRLLVPFAWTSVDIACRIACLGAAFAAVGAPLSPMQLLTGFTVGLAAGSLSLVPGGLGVLEGTMTAVFVRMGVELHVAATAAVVYRFAYYVVPFAAVSPLYRDLLRRRALPPGEQRA